MTKVTIDRALIEQALEAIELNWKTDEGDAVKPLLRAALAEPAKQGQEPVTWSNPYQDILESSRVGVEVGSSIERETRVMAKASKGPVKGLFVDLIAQFPGLAEELAAIVIDAPPAEPAVEPRNHVGNSKFESWYSEYNASGKGDKQRARDAYAAGMGDPVYLPSPPPLAEPAVEPVAWWVVNKTTDEKFATTRPDDWNNLNWLKYPLFTSPQPPAEPARTSQDVCTVPLLSDEEIHGIYDEVARSEPYSGAVTRRNVARAIEQLVRRKAGL